jgi:hypothetical protein
MRTRLALIGTVLALSLPAAQVTAADAATAKLPFRAVLIAETHVPQANTRWRFTVKVTDPTGRPLSAALRVYVYEAGRRRDTIGWFGMKGTFTKTIRWASNTRGHSLTFRVVVLTAKARQNLDYWVKPR